MRSEVPAAVNEPGHRAVWNSFGLASLALSFVSFSVLSHQILSTKGSLGGLHAKAVSVLSGHPFIAAVSLLFFLGFVIYFLSILRTGSPVGYLQTRRGAAMLLISAGLCQLPIYFTARPVDAGDLLCHVNAIAEASASYRAGEWPFYTFRYANGTTLGLQYPMLRTLLGGALNLLLPAQTDLNLEFLCAAAHLFMLAGLYRVLRTCRFSRLACALPALTLTGCHEMLLYYISASVPTLVASALAVWAFHACLRWFQSGKLRHALRTGYWLGLCVLAHPVTALFTVYFLAPPFFFALFRAPGQGRQHLLAQAAGAGLLTGLVAFPYLVSLKTLGPFNTYQPGQISAFQDSVVRIGENCKWVVKYLAAPTREEAGEYISLILFALIAAGWITHGRRFIASARKSGTFYLSFAACLFVGGAILFYGRDSPLVSAIPGVKLLKVNNRSFIFFAAGLALAAAKPLDLWLRRPRWIGLLMLLLFLEQCPYWLRPAYFSLPENQRLRAADFATYPLSTSSFLVIWPQGAGNTGDREDYLFHSLGYSGISTLDHEEQSQPGLEVNAFHSSLAVVHSPSEAAAILQRLRWLRVTDVIWRQDVPMSIDLRSFGEVRPVTNGIDLHLAGPTMERGLREARLSIVPDDLQPNGTTLLPVGFSPFLHCWQADQPDREIPLMAQNGYTAIARLLPAGTSLILKARTPPTSLPPPGWA